MKPPLFDPLLHRVKWEPEMSDKEVVEYYYKHIRPNDKWEEENGKFYYFVEDYNMFFEHSGSDIFMCMRPAVFAHIKKVQNL